MLEDDTDLCANLVRVDTRIGDVLAREEDLPIINAFQEVGAAKEGGLTGTGCTQEDHDLVTTDVKVEAAQHDIGSEALDDALDAQNGFIAGRLGVGLVRDCCLAHQTVPPICSRLRRRAVYQSERRMKGKDKMMKKMPATT